MEIKNFWKEIEIKKLFKPQYFFYLIAAPLFFLSRSEYFGLWFFNITILSILSPIFLIFLGLWTSFFEHNKKSDQGSFLTSASIILAILFFLIQGYTEDKNKMQAIFSIDNYNCNIARTNLALQGKETTNFALMEFLVDDYKLNYGFLYNKMSKKFGDFYGQNLRRMESVNSLIKITQSNTDPNNLQLHNKQIIEISQRIEKNMCNKDTQMFEKKMESNNKDSYSSTSTQISHGEV